MKSHRRSLLPGFARMAVAFLVAASCSIASAATIFVTTTADSVGFGDGCSLREALINANTDSVAGSLDCAQGDPGNDTIVLSPGTYYINSSLTDESNPALGDIDITGPVTLLGGFPFVVLDASSSGRIFDVQPGGSLTLDGVRLLHGYESVAGGVIRVRGAGTLTMTDSVVTQSKLDPLQSNGKGAGVYLEQFATGSISRTELSYLEAGGLNGEGAAVYCDGCTLQVSASTFARNSATYAGGGIYAAPGSSVDLYHVTAGYNTALLGGGIYNEGVLALDGLMSANNGTSATSGDLACNGTTPTAQYSFADHHDCGSVPGLLSRTGLDPSVNLGILRDYIYQPFLDSVSRVLIVEAGESYFANTIPAADCTGNIDQYGRHLPSSVNCSYGAMQSPAMYAYVMTYEASVADGPQPFDVYFSSPTDVYVTLRPISGVGESCDMPSQTILYHAGDSVHTYWISPGLVFPVPVLGRSVRVCEFEAAVTPTSVNPGDPPLSVPAALDGMTSGSYYIQIKDNSASLASGISTPAVGTYLDIGTVPVATGGTRPITFHPDVGGWNITSYMLTGTNASKFSVTTPMPLLVNDRLSGGSLLNVSCQGGEIGEYVAQLVVYTDNPAWPSLIYGVHCKVAHFLSVNTVNTTVNENVAPSGMPVMTLSLDSPNIGVPFDVVVSDLGGTATAGGDYQAFAQTVHFAVGDSAKVVPITLIDDRVYEDTETLSLSAVADPAAGLVQSGGEPTTITIVDNEKPGDNIQVAVAGLPSHVPAGARIQASITVTNTAALSTNPDSATRAAENARNSLSQMMIVTGISAPAQIVSYTLANSNCVISKDYRSASCPVPVTLAPQDSVTVNMLIQMAEMNDQPQTDVSGTMGVTVTALSGGKKSAKGENVTDFVIFPKEHNSIGGSLGSLGLLLMTFGLALRRRRS